MCIYIYTFVCVQMYSLQYAKGLHMFFFFFPGFSWKLKSLSTPQEFDREVHDQILYVTMGKKSSLMTQLNIPTDEVDKLYTQPMGT